MRMMLKVTVPTEAGNRALKDGSFQKTMEEAISRLKPEAAYFIAEKGRRCALLFFDMQSSSDLPKIAEPFFMGFDAEIEVVPAMNANDLQKGLAAAT
jgi:hypothetical protein